MPSCHLDSSVTSTRELFETHAMLLFLGNPKIGYLSESHLRLIRAATARLVVLLRSTGLRWYLVVRMMMMMDDVVSHFPD